MAVVVAILIAIGAGVLVMGRRNSQPVTTSKNELLEDENVNLGSQRTTLKSLLNTGTDQVCTFSDPDSGSTGNIYLGGGQARAEFETPTDTGDLFASNMISDGTTMYIWFEGQNTGFTASLESFDDLPSSAASGGTATEGVSEGVNVNREVDYSCDPWTVEETMFEVPTDIKFVDYREKTLQKKQEILRPCHNVLHAIHFRQNPKHFVSRHWAAKASAEQKFFRKLLSSGILKGSP